MDTTLRRITALLLALALVLSLSGTGLAAEADSADASAPETSAQSTDIGPAEGSDPAGGSDSAGGSDPADLSQADASACAEGSAEPAPAPADSSAEEAAEEPEEVAEAEPDPASEVSGDGEDGSGQADALTDQEEPSDGEVQPQEEPAVIWWQVEGERYAEKVSFLYTGKERKPAYRLFREGAQVERKAEWTEQWYTDEACTRPAAEFVSVGTRYLRLMEGDVVRAQGSYSIVKAAQSITVKSSALDQSFKRGKTFSLNAKSSGDGKLSFRSSDPSVVTVNASGVCKMKKVGVADITVTAAETQRYSAAEGTVTVKLYIRPRKLSYSKAYRRSRYYKALTKLKLTGSLGVNAADIALSQLGYREGRKSGELAGNGKGWNMSNWTEYGRYYGLNHQPWCAMFVNWCAREAGASYSVVPKYCAVRDYHSYFRRRGRFHSWHSIRSGSYKPKKGDIILYANSRGGVAHHIGYVLSSSAADGKVKLTTVEGNTRDAVRKVSMKFSKKSSGRHGEHYILGVASPKW